jgi:alpha,alpha-trehalose phosphorylase
MYNGDDTILRMDGFMKYKKEDFIVTREDRLKLEDLLSDETIFSLANGTLGTRGHFIEGYGTNDDPITLMNGFYNQYPFRYEENYEGFPQLGQTIVNLPDGSYVKIVVDDDIIDLSHMELVSIKRSLNMLEGTSYRKVRYISDKGYIFDLIEEKMVTSKQNLIVTKLDLSSPNYEGKIKLQSYLRLPAIRYVENTDPRLPNTRKHLELIDLKTDDKHGLLYAKTTNTSLFINAAITHDQAFNYQMTNNEIIGLREAHLTKNKSIVFTKYTYYTSSLTHENHEKDIKYIENMCKPFDAYLQEETKERIAFWDKSLVELSDTDINQALRYNLYQLSQSASTNYHMHIAAKGISGEGYEGHFFWDTETYMLPFFILTDPKKAKELLLYRYYTLDEARHEAKQLGCHRGAKIPWRTINGKEASPYFPAGSAQVHINSDIALAIINYYYATKDEGFMIEYGMEIIIETALFLLDYGHFKDGKFHIYNVTGPDEYTVLINDNYYTNNAAKHHFKFTHDYISSHKDELKDVLLKTDLKEEDIILLEKAYKNMTLLVDDQLNIVKQDDSFLSKKDINISDLDSDKFPLLLYYHPLFIYRYQIIKQADAILALVLFNEVDKDMYKNSFDYYIKRTTHDSSLSKCIYGISAYQIGYTDLAYEFFKRVSELDFRDSHNRTQHGLHIANLGGSYLMLIYGILGFRFNETFELNPIYQTHISSIKTTIVYQQTTINLQIEDNSLYIEVDRPIKMNLHGKSIEIKDKFKYHIIKNSV